ncbi:flagellar protein FlgN [Planococcus halotolerans]|uniref:Flagellar protein FlgN n=2 Tax=Planococcus halotolerans TaxID=2233542 RepID=A0A365KR07_9BACL|nr:flagellar protein FlgN [Planococcus halotolerans]RAZ75580.1 flagellar protein FlgN [Planococcus halotolerans]
MLNAMVTALDQLIDVQQQLITCADNKKAALIERNVDNLNGVTKEEKKLVKQLEQAEQERMAAMESVAQDSAAAGFQSYLDQLPDGQARQKIESQLKTLQELTAELQAKNKINDRLLKDSMSFVQHMIDQITKSQQQQFNYQSPMGQAGQKSQTSNRGFFDTKA